MDTSRGPPPGVFLALHLLVIGVITGSAAAGCSKYYTVKSGDICNAIAQSQGTTTATIMSLNPAINSGCTNLQIGQVLCVASSGTNNGGGTTGTGSSCADLYSQCADWAKQGYCASNWVLSGKSIHDVVCPATCGACTSSGGGGGGSSGGGGSGSTGCYTPNSQYSPIDNVKMSDGSFSGRTVESGAYACQQRCARVTGCTYFSFWADGGCHLSSSAASLIGSTGTTAGSASCGGGGSNGGGGSGGGSGSTGAGLSQTNAYRQKHHAPSMTWDTSIASHAQSWANTLAAGCKFEHGGHDGEGQNLFASGGTQYTWNQVIDSWYNEVRSYRFTSKPWTDNSPNFGAIGHFTQLVWVGSTRLGCAMATNTKCNGMQYFYVCHYGPTGNFVDDSSFKANVLPA